MHTGTIRPWPAGRSGRIVRTVLSKLASPAALRSAPPTGPATRRADPGRVGRARVVLAVLAAAVLLTLGNGIAFGATTYAASCGANLRTGAGTTYAIKQSISTGTQVSVVSTVTGGSWSATCAGKAASGTTWFRISAVGGRTASSLYGVTYVYGATGLFKAVTQATLPPSASPASTTGPAASGSPSPSPSGSPGPTTLPATVTFYGRGYGHGVGMSQYGAYGRALAGQDDLTILAHYYQHTTVSTTSNNWVRVLVLSSWTASSTGPLRLYGLSGTFTFDGIATVFPAGAQARLVPTVVSSTSTTWRLVVLAADGVTKLYDAPTTGDLWMRPAQPATVLRLYSKPSSYDQYLGNLHIMAKATAPTVSVVNQVRLESYLRGVVPSEMPYFWPTAALEAQAIASRGYAVYHLHPTTGTYDVYDDTRSQVYHGVIGEEATTDAAITATAGVVLRYGTAIADTFYHSTGGGATENNEDAWPSASGAIIASPVAYLRGSSDRAPDGTSYDNLAPYATWHTATYTLAQIQAFFAVDSRTDVGTLVAIDLTHRGVSGRLISVTLYGADGTIRTVSGPVFVAIFNAHRPSTDPPMRDALFDLAPIP